MDTNESQTGFKEQIGEFSQKKKRKDRERQDTFKIGNYHR